MGCGQSQEQRERLAKQRELDEKLTKKRDEVSQQKKLLLLGPGNSGKSTFFKQLLKIHTGDFSGTSFNRKSIHTALINQLRNISSMILERGERLEIAFEEEVLKMCQTITDMDDEEISAEMATKVADWWAHDSVKQAFEKRDNLGIVDSTPYFLDRIEEIAEDDYKPTEKDIILVRIKTTGIVSKSFTVEDDHGKSHEFVIHDCGGQRSERKKWVRVFADTTAVLYVASLSCYDQLLYEDLSVNAMDEALEIFSEILNSRWFKTTAVILFLNKLDLFEIKIKEVPLKVCFEEYDGPNEVKEAGEYIQKKFEDLNEVSKRPIFAHFTCATDRDTVKRVFANVQQVVVQEALRAAAVW